MTEEQINETLTALLAPLLKNCTLSVSHKMHASAHGTAFVGLMFDAGWADFSAKVEARFTWVNGIIAISDKEKFINDAVNALGREVFKA